MSDVFASIVGDVISSYALIFQTGRAIGTIIPDVTMEEVHHDELIITDHPVEIGAAISDHAFKMPSEVEMRVGFSDSSAGFQGYSQVIYQSLLDLQKQREPFDVSTGKRQYSNMLIRGLEVTTDPHSEYVLQVVANLREIIIVNTDTTGSAAQTSQAIPQSTSPVQDQGTLNLQPISPAPSSVAVFSQFGAGGASTLSPGTLDFSTSSGSQFFPMGI